MKVRNGLPLVALLIAAQGISGCGNQKETTVDFGPEIDPAEIEEALYTPMQDVDPLKIKIGEFVHFAETQRINVQNLETAVSDTGQTVVSMRELPDRLIFTIIENKITYQGDESRKTSTERELAVPLAAAAVRTNASGPFEVSEPVASLTQTHVRNVLQSRNAPLTALANVLGVKQNAVHVTYHNLRSVVESIRPPDAVTKQPNCLDIPNCMIRVHKVSFDQVVWETPDKPNKVAFEFTMSAEVPYLASLLDKCATLLVDVPTGEGDKQTKILLKQCSPVLNFRWEVPQG